MSFRFSKIIIFALLLLPLQGSHVFASDQNCVQRFLKSLGNFLTPAPPVSKLSYSFTAEELKDVESFLKISSEIRLEGFNKRIIRYQELALQRYSTKPDIQAINAFGNMDNFRIVNDGFFADVQIKTIDKKLYIEIPEIGAKNGGRWGRETQGLDLGLAQFFATVRKGIEYRLSKNKNLELVLVLPSKVVNRKLKMMLHDLGFTKTSELPDWGEVKGYLEGMGPAAEFKMELKVERKVGN